MELCYAAAPKQRAFLIIVYGKERGFLSQTNNMFEYIKGTLEDKAEQQVVIDVGGIGFKIYTSLNSVSDTSVNIGENVKFYTYMYIKEGIMDLYGFSTKEEKNLFELLISVSGVGAKGAVAVLSVMSPSKLALAIAADDAASIRKAQGIGAKTAQRICLELKDKIKNEDIVSENTDAFEANTPTEKSDMKSDAVSALISLGYSRQEASVAVGKVKEDCASVEDYIRLALKNML